ncbi:hypothetical protein ABNX05_22835 [Lysinibacillus sp. M3]|uniref:Uncharacterized protein n=1 Tax=Lysinibacillus zambalensis TaxID=3160866 RepID=A0ABV1MZW9_9BACI
MTYVGGFRQMLFARKRQQQGFNCAKAKRQQQGFNCAKAKRQQQQQQQQYRCWSLGCCHRTWRS